MGESGLSICDVVTTVVYAFSGVVDGQAGEDWTEPRVQIFEAAEAGAVAGVRLS